jgi:hypothetical protein
MEEHSGQNAMPVAMILHLFLRWTSHFIVMFCYFVLPLHWVPKTEFAKKLNQAGMHTDWSAQQWKRHYQSPNYP